MHKVLIIGPIEDFGGREIETGFIAESLSQNYLVDICSTGNISEKSQVYEFNLNGEITSLKKEIFKKYFILRSLSYFSYLKNKKKQTNYFYVNNNISKKLEFNKKENIVLFNLLSKYDVIFIVANIGTLRTKEIIEMSKKLYKKLIFRTTGEIGDVKGLPEYLKGISVFLHHSEKNAMALHKDEIYRRYRIIDQTTQNEKEILKNNIPSKPVTNFGIISRLSRGKNIETLINYFLKSSSITDKLYIIGDGDLKDSLRLKYSDNTNIIFKGFIPSKNLSIVFQEFECLIIPSASEAGPLVGVEAMAASKIILSTKVGAMEERLKGTTNDFWFDITSFTSFNSQFLKIKNLSTTKVADISLRNRNKYLKNYSKETIANLYKTAISEVLST